MIPTVTNYLYDIHHNKVQMMTQMERRRAITFLCAIALCVTITIVLWLR